MYLRVYLRYMLEGQVRIQVDWTTRLDDMDRFWRDKMGGCMDELAGLWRIYLAVTGRGFGAWIMEWVSV